MKLTEKHMLALKNLAERALALANEEPQFSEYIQMPPFTSVASRAMNLALEALPLLGEIQAVAQAQETDDLVARLAMRYLPWDAAGNAAAEQLAVQTARRVLALARGTIAPEEPS